jgi:transcriptional regulator with XRE-family HTH domain
LVAEAGEAVRKSRTRRGVHQATLAARAGISQPRPAAIEAGHGGGAPLEVWLALAEALGRYLRFEFARDPQAEVADAGHLAMQELVARVAKPAGWEISIEAPGPRWDSSRSIDVRLTDRQTRQIVIVECWNTFSDLGAAARSGDRKIRDEEQRAVAIAGGGGPFRVGLVWIVRDTKANRELIARYPNFFDTRLPGSSTGWPATVAARSTMPTAPGLIWCDLAARRLFARRRGQTAAGRIV